MYLTVLLEYFSCVEWFAISLWFYVCMHVCLSLSIYIYIFIKWNLSTWPQRVLNTHMRGWVLLLLYKWLEFGLFSTIMCIYIYNIYTYAYTYTRVCVYTYIHTYMHKEIREEREKRERREYIYIYMLCLFHEITHRVPKSSWMGPIFGVWIRPTIGGPMRWGTNENRIERVRLGDQWDGGPMRTV